MTRAERLLILLTADAVIAGALNPCAKVEVEALRKARQALDEEAFQLSRRKIVITVGDQQWVRWETVDPLRDAWHTEPLSFVGPLLSPLKPEPDAAALERAQEALSEQSS